MGIQIGDRNKISNSTIAENINTDRSKSWIERHPFIISIFASIIAGFIMLFSFWDKIVSLIENLLRG